MARKLDKGKYEPGVIYRLCFLDGMEWIPFYVGESCQPTVRESQHRRGAGSDDFRLVYEATRQMEEARIEWKMIVFAAYGEDGPEATEDEAILATLADGYALTNMQKGNAHWMEQKLAEVAEMKSLRLTPREYRARKRELMLPDTVMAASDVAQVAKATGRRLENPKLIALRKRTSKWDVSTVQEHIRLLKMNRYKYSDLSFSNEMALWTAILAEKHITDSLLS